MTPGSEVAGIGVVDSVGLRIRINLSIIHSIGDHERYLVGSVACADILAVAAATSGAVRRRQSRGTSKDCEERGGRSYVL